MCHETEKCGHKNPHEHNKNCGQGICSQGYSICVEYAETKTQGENENMNEIKIGYKVVKVNSDNKLVSASVDKGSTEYGVGVTTKPKMWGGPLTVFASKFRAIGFIAELSDATRPLCRVYKCHYETTKAQAVWRLVNYMPESKKLSDLPEGTILAKNVTLNEEIFRA